MKNLGLAVFLLVPSAMFAQLETAKIYNAATGAPVAVSGSVVCEQRVAQPKTQNGRQVVLTTSSGQRIETSAYSLASGELKFTNTSERNIVALDVVTNVKCTHGRPMPLTHHFDRLFFTTSGLASGESISGPVPDMEDELFPRDLDQTAVSPRANVEVRFVQFEDGSTWGDASVLKDVRARRIQMEAFLKRLAAAGDDREFDQIVDKALMPTANRWDHVTAWKISLVRRESGTPAAQAAARERLRIAMDRESSGKF